MATIAFWMIAGLTIGSALLVALCRNVLHAAFALMLTFTGVAGLYLFLGAPFVAAVQIIIYVGGVVILVVFAVMFSSRLAEESRETGRLNLVPGTMCGLIALAVTLAVIVQVVTPRVYASRAMRHSEDAAIRTYDDRAPFRVWTDARWVHTYADKKHRKELEAWREDGRNRPKPTIEQARADARYEWEVARYRWMKDRYRGVRARREEGDGKGARSAVPVVRPTAPRPPSEPQTEPGVMSVGSLLVTRYVLPFEIAAVLLVAVMIGALVIVRKEIKQD